MLTVSDIANLYTISYQQVQYLIDYGYLTVAEIDRNNQKGISYLFSEEDVEQTDIHSCLAEIRDLNTQYRPSINRANEFKSVLRTISRYDSFLENIQDIPEETILRVSFFLFHLNHYAKTFGDDATELYRLKSSVIKKMYLENPELLTAVYLQGPDRKRIWLCEDCKDSARNAGLSYVSYIRHEYYCPKCEIQVNDREYYSLIEFQLQVEGYRFCFHQPLSKAIKWMKGIDQLPHLTRQSGRYVDQMYLYGRAVSKIEEKVFPLKMVQAELEHYLQKNPGEA